ncbi:MAG: TetR/AcrR family transcriptional regulator [Planctomycetales bacterium]|nr:TetR/AcrR family transcriptional regulator [Planctomycetales bacterium]
MATREKLIQAGLNLFHRHGIHLVGLDRVLRKAGVTKTTFYNYFESKEHFACAVIDRFGEELHSRIYYRLEGAHEASAEQRLLRVFDAWDELFDNDSFRGCLLVGASVACGDKHDPTRKAAIRNKRALLDLYEEIARQSGISNPAQFAIRFGVLVDGLLVARHLYGDQREVKEARKMAVEMIANALKDSQ